MQKLGVSNRTGLVVKFFAEYAELRPSVRSTDPAHSATFLPRNGDMVRPIAGGPLAAQASPRPKRRR
jgi:hypothetical protein